MGELSANRPLARAVLGRPVGARSVGLQTGAHRRFAALRAGPNGRRYREELVKAKSQRPRLALPVFTACVALGAVVAVADAAPRTVVLVIPEKAVPPTKFGAEALRRA